MFGKFLATGGAPCPPESLRKEIGYIAPSHFAALPNFWRTGLSPIISGTLIAPFVALVVTLVYYRLCGEAQVTAPPSSGEAHDEYRQTP